MKVRMLRRAGTTYQATIGNPRVVALITAAGIAVGVIAWLSGERGLANGVWSLVTAIALVPLLAAVARDLLRREPGVDLIALLAMSSALLLGQSLAGAVVALHPKNATNELTADCRSMTRSPIWFVIIRRMADSLTSRAAQVTCLRGAVV